MARTVSEIEESILSNIAANPVLSGVLTSTSKVAIWRLLVYIFSVAAWALESLFDQHREEVAQAITDLRPPYTPWLKQKVLDFQFGFDLPQDQIDYDNTGIDPDVIAASKVVKYVAIVELERGIKIKVATIIDGSLAPLPVDQLAALIAYVKRIKGPGVGFEIVNKVADRLKIVQRVYYNPSILDEQGRRLDGTDNTPVQAGIAAFLKAQPFNGQYIINRHERAVEAINGVVIAPIMEAQAAYESVPFEPFDVSA